FIGTAVLRARFKRPATGQQALIGTVAEVRAPLAPTGLVYLHGELWTATVEGQPEGTEVPVGNHVEVTAVQGLRLIVRPVSETAQRESAPPPLRSEGVLPVPGGVRSQRREPGA
ncbi:MAG: hypothetical protein M3121_08125, partial [Chloroflexota bacterium]|nr:hypothetical protein [Chloroflexota bacterium]